MLRVLRPWYMNTSKRLVKKPKVYIRDSGVLHCLSSIASYRELLSHRLLGASWEGFALEQIARILNKRDDELFFWQVHSGSQLDLLWQAHGKNWGVEFNFSDAPKTTKSMKIALFPATSRCISKSDTKLMH